MSADGHLSWSSNAWQNLPSLVSNPVRELEANIVSESAVAHLSAPNNPLSSEVITTVASEFIALSNRIKTERLFAFKELTCKRYGEFAIRVNLMSLSILSHSATFREAAETWDDANWSTLVEYIGGNAVSIGAFARVRDLN